MAKITAMEQKRKRLKMTPSQFYAIPKSPPSDSRLPIFDKSHVRNAMARLIQVHGISRFERWRAAWKIRRAARKFKIDVDEFKKHLRR